MFPCRVQHNPEFLAQSRIPSEHTLTLWATNGREKHWIEGQCDRPPVLGLQNETSASGWETRTLFKMGGGSVKCHLWDHPSPRYPIPGFSTIVAPVPQPPRFSRDRYHNPRIILCMDEAPLPVVLTRV